LRSKSIMTGQIDQIISAYLITQERFVSKTFNFKNKYGRLLNKSKRFALKQQLNQQITSIWHTALKQFKTKRKRRG